jgi:hypothetical protein
MKPPSAPGVGPAAAHPAAQTDSSADVGAAERKRLDDVFGEVLPDVTSDERDPSDSAGFSEDWYRQNRPPHHG